VLALNTVAGEQNLISCGGQRTYSPDMSPRSPEKPSQTTHPNARPRVGSDGASVCPPVLIEVSCECGRRQLVHAHDTMAYAQACMGCVAAPTGRRGCPGVCFSLN
jgi:hypothetical protein